MEIVNFFFLISVFIMIIQILLLSIVVPKSQEIAKSKLRSSDVDYFEGLIKPKKFNDTIKGLTIFAEDKDINDELKNIYLGENKYHFNYMSKDYLLRAAVFIKRKLGSEKRIFIWSA